MSVFESETSTFHGFNPELQTQLQAHMQETAAEEHASLGRQNSSILSLTLDEIQMKSGKSFGAMNMDEFLASLWPTIEENDDNRGAGASHEGAKTTVLQRQGSLSVPEPLCKKTVDEVWFEMQSGVQQPPSSTSAQNSDEDICRQQTLGEITLEDFLVKAGVVQEPLRMASSDSGSNPEFGVGLHCQTQNGYGDNRPVYNEIRPFYSTLGESSSCMTGNGRSNQYLTGLDAFRIKKRRITDGPPEILMERRQRPMIKNRESAYTVELELELNQLTEENMKLKAILTTGRYD
ncbi:hypothetical protein Bca101_043201 [Brassica carinata]